MHPSESNGQNWFGLPVAKFRFSIRTMLIGTTGIAAALIPINAMGYDGFWYSIIILFVVGILIYLTRYPFFEKLLLLGMVLLGGYMGSCLAKLDYDNYRLDEPSELDLAMERSQNLLRIADGIFAFQIDHGHFPPPWTVDKDGNRLHNWRVLILPYVKHDPILDEIDRNKAWDHPSNTKFHALMPEVFRSVGFPSKTKTGFIAVAGPGTVWQKQGVNIADFTDPASETLLLVESRQHAANWMALDETTPDEFCASALLERSKNRYTLVLTCLGEVKVLPHSIGKRQIHAGLTINGSEVESFPIQSADFDANTYGTERHNFEGK